MKAIYYSLLFTVLFSLGCKKSKNTSNVKDGNYSGILKVTTSANPTSTATYPMFILFDMGKFTITPDLTRKPVAGSGSYYINNNIASFTDTKFYTADFDWNLILNGDYDVEINGDNLTLTKRFDKKTNIDPATSYATLTYQYILKLNK